jgi:prepilin-type processing-associated H-X9-DG protein
MEDIKPSPHPGSFTGWYIVSIILAAAIMFLVPTIQSYMHVSSGTACKNNLDALYQGMMNYVSVYGGQSDYPPHTGGAFLNCLRGRCGGSHPPSWEKQAPLAGRDDLFVCPDSGRAASESALGYKGPGVRGLGTDVLTGRTPPDRVIAADASRDNHRGRGGNVLRFDGSVQFRDADEFDRVDTVE